MCSNLKSRGGDGCGNFVELINGPIGNLVGIGVKALIDRASAATPPSGSRNVNTAGQISKEREKIEKFYDNIEAHLKGTLRVLKPAIEIKNVLHAECRSAGHERPGRNDGSTRLVYYTPQNRKKCQINNCRGGGGCCDETETRTGTTKKEMQQQQQQQEKFNEAESSRCSMSTSLYSCKAQSTPSQTQAQQNNSRCKRLKINVSKIDPPPPPPPPSPIRRETRRRLCELYETEKKYKNTDKVPRCLMCKVTLRDNSLLAILPCKHSFCYACLGKNKGPKCQKCNESFDMKNVTQFSTLY